MVEIKTCKNFLVRDEEKAGYCFKSSTNQVLSTTQLAKEFSNFNASITEPDALSMLSIERTLVCRYLRLGYTIDLPWCRIYARANGTTDSPQGLFSVGTGNHRFKIIMEMKQDALTEIGPDIEHVQVASDYWSDPKILDLACVGNDAQETKVLEFDEGMTLRLKGRNLKFAADDVAQGVFLINDGVSVRCTKYARIGTNIIDAVIPAEIVSGIYKVKVVAKTGTTRYAEHVAKNEIIIL